MTLYYKLLSLLALKMTTPRRWVTSHTDVGGGEGGRSVPHRPVLKLLPHCHRA